jgi:PHS family inorganic phosphate transporter-like MFS transporter
MSISDGIELMIILTSTFTQALAGSGPRVNIIGVLTVWRFIMGVGVGMGADHPLSAVTSSEFASAGSRGRLMTTVFTAQGWANFGTRRHLYMEAGNTKLVLAASLVALITVHACRGSILSDNNGLEHVDYCWRILIGLGCVPGAIALYFRLTTPETPRFTMDIDRDIQRARADTGNVLGPNGDCVALYRVDPDADAQRADAPCGSRRDFINYFAHPSNLSLLFGATYSWFAVEASPIHIYWAARW